MEQIRISSFNVRGMNNELKRQDILDYLREMKSNIYCLQDIHCSQEQIPTFKKMEWRYDNFMWYK